MTSAPSRFAYLGSGEAKTPDGIWGWSKRLADDLNNNKLLGLGFNDLKDNPLYNVSVSADGYSFELSAPLIVINGALLVEAVGSGFNVTAGVGHGYFYNDVKVVGAQGAAVADLTAAATLNVLPAPTGAMLIADASAPTNAELLKFCIELMTKLDIALVRLRDHGLIAP